MLFGNSLGCFNVITFNDARRLNCQGGVVALSRSLGMGVL